MGDKKKNVVGSIRPKKVKGRRKSDGTVEILEELKKPEPPDTELDSASFSDRERLKEELLRQKSSEIYGPTGKLKTPERK